MHLRSAFVGSASLLGVLCCNTAAEACFFEAPTVGWSPDAQLPCSLAEADLLANTARDAPPELTDQNRRTYDQSFYLWFLRASDAAARASAWYLTDAIGEAPFSEQAQQRWQTEYEPLPELGPSTAAYVLLGETSWTDSEKLAAALTAEPRDGISPEQYIDALENAGSLFDDLVNAANADDDGSDEDLPDYADWVSGRTTPITKQLFYRCRMASTKMRVWTAASRRCEVWLGQHWKSQIELASLDELLPLADQVPLVQQRWAPAARNDAGAVP